MLSLMRPLPDLAGLERLGGAVSAWCRQVRVVWRAPGGWCRASFRVLAARARLMSGCRDRPGGASGAHNSSRGVGVGPDELGEASEREGAAQLGDHGEG